MLFLPRVKCLHVMWVNVSKVKSLSVTEYYGHILTNAARSCMLIRPRSQAYMSVFTCQFTVQYSHETLQAQTNDKLVWSLLISHLSFFQIYKSMWKWVWKDEVLPKSYPPPDVIMWLTLSCQQMLHLSTHFPEMWSLHYSLWVMGDIDRTPSTCI